MSLRPAWKTEILSQKTTLQDIGTWVIYYDKKRRKRNYFQKKFSRKSNATLAWARNLNYRSMRANSTLCMDSWVLGMWGASMWRCLQEGHDGMRKVGMSHGSWEVSEPTRDTFMPPSQVAGKDLEERLIIHPNRQPVRLGVCQLS